MNDLVQNSETSYIANRLKSFSESVRSLPGIRKKDDSALLASNIVQSVYKYETRQDSLNKYALNPINNEFDPLKLAVYHLRQNNRMEAWWLVFLSCWFEYNDKDGWKLLQAIYFRLGENVNWDWQRVVYDCEEFGQWLINRQPDIGKLGRMGGRHKQPAFDNHQAIKTKEVLCYFINWWKLNHEEVIEDSRLKAGASPKVFFRNMYNYVFSGLNIDRYLYYRFLTCASFLNLADMEPDQPFIANGSFYKKTVRGLFQEKNGKELPVKDLTQCIVEMAEWLNIPFPFLVLEDALSKYFLQKQSDR